MTKIYRTALLGSLVAIAVTGCANEAETPEPVVEEAIDAMPEVTPVDDALLPDTADASEDGSSSAMESGSNDESTRQPDPRRTKLIKADPN